MQVLFLRMYSRGGGEALSHADADAARRVRIVVMDL